LLGFHLVLGANLSFTSKTAIFKYLHSHSFWSIWSKCEKSKLCTNIKKKL